MKKITLLAVLFITTGCSSSGIGREGSPMWSLTASDEAKVSYYRKQCRLLGMETYSDKWYDCIMEMSRRAEDRAAQAVDSLNKTAERLKSPPANTPKNTTCRMVGNVIRCTEL